MTVYSHVTFNLKFGQNAVETTSINSGNDEYKHSGNDDYKQSFYITI
jgi:hypothetical protein